MRLNREQHKQSGSALMMAIFVLVVVGLLGASMVSLLKNADESVAREVISTRALLAAESGAQRKIQQLFPTSGAANCAAINDLSLSGPGFGNCFVDVTCAAVSPEGTDTYYTVTSTGRCETATDTAVRVVEVQARTL
ncbi:MAG: hypothetical protein ACR2P1_04055 [Pseudomonadales bacterium]